MVNINKIPQSEYLKIGFNCKKEGLYCFSKVKGFNISLEDLYNKNKKYIDNKFLEYHNNKHIDDLMNMFLPSVTKRVYKVKNVDTKITKLLRKELKERRYIIIEQFYELDDIIDTKNIYKYI